MFFLSFPDRGIYLDPTDAKGELSAFPGPGTFWPFPVDLTMAYVNEPLPAGSTPRRGVEDVGGGGGGPHCSVEDGPDPVELLFVTQRDIAAGEEIFIDYGLKYDRSKYGGS